MKSVVCAALACWLVAVTAGGSGTLLLASTQVYHGNVNPTDSDGATSGTAKVLSYPTSGMGISPANATSRLDASKVFAASASGGHALADVPADAAFFAVTRRRPSLVTA